LRRQRVRNAPPVGIDEDAARVQEYRLERHAQLL
jgi:hypothetical protein